MSTPQDKLLTPVESKESISQKPSDSSKTGSHIEKKRTQDELSVMGESAVDSLKNLC